LGECGLRADLSRHDWEGIKRIGTSTLFAAWNDAA